MLFTQSITRLNQALFEASNIDGIFRSLSIAFGDAGNLFLINSDETVPNLDNASSL